MAIDTKTISVTLSKEQRYALEDVMYERGYLSDDYVTPAKTVEMDIPCPNCGNNMTLYSSGNSYQVTCETESLILATCRGL